MPPRHDNTNGNNNTTNGNNNDIIQQLAIAQA
jgi:hypothetical protein